MRHFLVVLLFCGISQSLVAQSVYSTVTIPSECLPNAHSVIRVHETNCRISQADEAEVEEWMVVTILNKEGASNALWVEREDEFVNVKSIKGSLYDADGLLIRESEKQDVKDFGSATDYEFVNAQFKALELEYTQFPFTVEFRVRKTIKGFFRIEDFVVQQLGQSVVASSLRFTAPASYAYQWKGVRTAVQPVVKESGSEKISTWNFTRLPAAAQEPYNPFFRDEYAKIIIAPMQVSIDGYSGRFSNWQQIGQFFYTLNQNRDVLSPAMQATVKKLVEGKSNNREKIEAIYKYLQDNHRYVSIQIGIGGWQTLDAAFVEKKKYGDCKALSNYMYAMLKVAGIESYVADIYGGSKGSPEWYDDTPIPYANHVILYVPGEDMWLECTSNTAPAGYLGDFTAGRPALLLTPQGGKLVTTPVLTAADNTQVSHIVIRLDEAGSAEVHTTIQASCGMHDVYRGLLAQKKQPDIETYFVEHAGFPIAQLHNLTITASASEPQADIDYAVKINNLVTKSGKRMFVPIHKINPFKRTLPANDKRMLDLEMRDAYTLKDTIEVQLPLGYKLENMPPAKQIASEFGQFNFQATQQENIVRIVRWIEIRPISVPATRYNEVRQFYQDLSKADGAQIVLVKI
jgi:transglutaminase-like putative cysteine protease